MFQAIFLLSRLPDNVPSDPKVTFERFLDCPYGHIFRLEELFAQFKDVRITERVGEMLNAEASSADLKHVEGGLPDRFLDAWSETHAYCDSGTPSPQEALASSLDLT